MSCKFYTKLPVSSQPVNQTCQNATKHPIQKNGLKQESYIYCELGSIIALAFRKQYEINQKLIARPSNSHTDPTGCQHETFPQFLHDLVAPTQLKCIYRAHETFASSGVCGSTFPDESGIRSSRNGSSRSRTTRGQA